MNRLAPTSMLMLGSLKFVPGNLRESGRYHVPKSPLRLQRYLPFRAVATDSDANVQVWETHPTQAMTRNASSFGDDIDAIPAR